MEKQAVSLLSNPSPQAMAASSGHRLTGTSRRKTGGRDRKIENRGDVTMTNQKEFMNSLDDANYKSIKEQ